MEDPTKESSGDNIEKIIRLTIRFTFEIDHDIHIDRNQYIGYDFQVDLIDYKAMFGYFAAQKLLRDEKTDLPISELWSGWELFEDWVLPISEPSVTFEVDHTLGLPLAVNLQHLYNKGVGMSPDDQIHPQRRIQLSCQLFIFDDFLQQLRQFFRGTEQ